MMIDQVTGAAPFGIVSATLSFEYARSRAKPA